MSAQQGQVIEHEDERKYFYQTPNIVDKELMLNVYEHRLLVHYYRVGVCWESVRTTAKSCKISVGSVVKYRESLKDKGLIMLTYPQNEDETIVVRTVALWAIDALYFEQGLAAVIESFSKTHEKIVQTLIAFNASLPKSKRQKLSTRSSGEHPRSSDEHPRSSDEPKKTTSKKTTSKKTEIKRAAAQRDELLDHPAIIMYREIMQLNVAKRVRADVAEAVGESEEAIERWEQVLKRWKLASYKPTSYDKIIAAFKNGFFDEKEEQQSASSGFDEVELEGV